MPEWLTNVGMILFVAFFFGFSVFIHEFGHLIAAVWRGLHVDKFSIGFGQRIIGFKRKGVDFIIGWLPFGGYVALPQMEPNEEPQTAEGKPLPSSKPLDRIIVALAGPLFNILFAFVLGVVLWKSGKPASAPLEKITISDIPNKSSDYQAGLRTGDQIVSINGKKISDTTQMQKNYLFDEQLTIDVIRDGKEISIGPFTPAKDPAFDLSLPLFNYDIDYKPVKAIVDKVPQKDPSGTALPAAVAGILPGDQFIKVNGKDIAYRSDVSKAIENQKGEELTFTVLRNGKEVDITIKPAKITSHIIGLSFINFPKIHQVSTEATAFKAGIRRWDIFKTLNGKEYTNFENFEAEMDKHKGKMVNIGIERDGELMNFDVKNEYVRYMIGVQWQEYRVYDNPQTQFKDVFSETFQTLNAIVSRRVDPSNLSGPIGISQGMFLQLKHLGWRACISFIFMINISLAVFNLLPLPVLDGGHIFIAMAELISRRKIPIKFIQPVTMIFILFFFSLMIYVSLHDVKRAGFEIKSVQNTAVNKTATPC